MTAAIAVMERKTHLLRCSTLNSEVSAIENSLQGNNTDTKPEKLRLYTPLGRTIEGPYVDQASSQIIKYDTGSQL